MAGNQTTLNGWIEVTWKNLVYLEQTRHDPNDPPKNSPGAFVYSYPSNAGTGNELPSTGTSNELPGSESAPGTADEIPSEPSTTTITEGEAKPFEGVSAGSGSVSFTSGSLKA